MSPLGRRFRDEDEWGKFKATRLDRPHKVSPLAAIFVHIAVTFFGGLAGLFLMATAGARLRLWGIYRLVGIHFPSEGWEMAAVLALGFSVGAAFTVAVRVQTARQFRGYEKKYGKREEDDNDSGE